MKHAIITACIAFLFSFAATGQTPVVINNYAVALNSTSCPYSITVDTATGFAVGDKVLVIQMKGVEIDTSNTSSFGTVTNWNNVGNYEINEVSSVSGTTLYLRYHLLRSYDFAFGRVQVVKMAHYNTYTISARHGCLPWNGRKGGVFAIMADDSLVMNDDIDVKGMGFRAGITDSPYSNGALPYHQTDYCYLHTMWHGGMKGEGSTEVSYLRLNCRGPLYNGGGGGNDHNSGGGGGG
ncbi:MAG: hypothetical protein EBZ77_07230, partial [Chitinophagia bacterium]|nr:hypothetical protein [Chitinophagia bacterium]